MQLAPLYSGAACWLDVTSQEALATLGMWPEAFSTPSLPPSSQYTNAERFSLQLGSTSRTNLVPGDPTWAFEGEQLYEVAFPELTATLGAGMSSSVLA